MVIIDMSFLINNVAITDYFALLANVDETFDGERI